MESLRQIGAGFLLGAISVIVVLGGFALAMAEGGMVPAATLPVSPTEDNTLVALVVTLFPALTPEVPGQADTPTLDFTATASPTPPPTSILCPPPAGWVPIIIQPYDTLDSLAQAYRTTVNLLRVNNCLLTDQLIANSILYVPPQPTSTLVPCGAPLGWVSYTVIAGDTLYRISLLYRVTVAALMQANCLNTSVIRAGQTLKVPNVPTSTPPVSSTPLQGASPTPTPTWTKTPTFTPTVGAAGTMTLTPTKIVGASPTQTVGASPTSPPTPSPTVTMTATVSATATETPSPTATPTPTLTATPTTPESK